MLMDIGSKFLISIAKPSFKTLITIISQSTTKRDALERRATTKTVEVHKSDYVTVLLICRGNYNCLVGYRGMVERRTTAAHTPVTNLNTPNTIEMEISSAWYQIYSHIYLA